MTWRLKFGNDTGTYLESLRDNVLSGSPIMDMELPGTVRHIGCGAIMGCYIQRLRLGAGLAEPEDADGTGKGQRMGGGSRRRRASWPAAAGSSRRPSSARSSSRRGIPISSSCRRRRSTK